RRQTERRQRRPAQRDFAIVGDFLRQDAGDLAVGFLLGGRDRVGDAFLFLTAQHHQLPDEPPPPKPPPPPPKPPPPKPPPRPPPPKPPMRRKGRKPQPPK